ncbi:MAG: hypothetical protein HY951_15335 [Bacteroidia bacterium]|nr:hypothetical protein [Bacteroidia bacterium]
MKNIIILICMCMFILNFTSCEPKEYIYYYEDQENIQNKVTEVPFKANDFRLKLDLGTDSIIVDKEKAAPISVKLVFIGQHQYYPPNLRFEVFVNNKQIKLADTICYNITTVLDDHVTYFKDSSTILNIPEIISKLKKEKNLPADLNYFSVVSAYQRYYIGNTTNPDTINVLIKTFWDTGKSITEKKYILKKVENKKEEYNLPIRPFG